MEAIDYVYVPSDKLPDRCSKCPFVNSADECILQDEDANFTADSWDDLQKGCPLHTINPEDLRTKGKWIAEVERTGTYSHCSECGCRCRGYVPNYKYCPNCGARMEETVCRDG